MGADPVIDVMFAVCTSDSKQLTAPMSFLVKVPTAMTLRYKNSVVFSPQANYTD
jgi:hypothetical protein